MKYRDLQIQTQREAPNNARTEGFSFLVRAGYLTRENGLTPLGKHAIDHLRELAERLNESFVSHLSLPTISNAEEVFFPIKAGSLDIIHCEACQYTERLELAQFAKAPFSQEEPLPMEKVLTPDCSSIETLANYLNVPKEKTAKALMFTRGSDHQFIFVVVRGDMTMSEAKLKKTVGEFRLATPEEITKAGAAAGYASPIGLKDTLIVVDDLIPQSPNLVAGANETSHHLLNTNCGRDYMPAITTDLTVAGTGAACYRCNHALTVHPAESLAASRELYFDKILSALAETHLDEKGLAFPKSIAPFDVYLMQVPGKEMDTRSKAGEIYTTLQNAGIVVLFDDRDERAGVKFNDADLIGCPLRVTVGEKNLKEGMVELKPRKEKENQLVRIENLIEEIKNIK